MTFLTVGIRNDVNGVYKVSASVGEECDECYRSQLAHRCCRVVHLFAARELLRATAKRFPLYLYRRNQCYCQHFFLPFLISVFLCILKLVLLNTAL